MNEWNRFQMEVAVPKNDALVKTLIRDWCFQDEWICHRLELAKLARKSRHETIALKSQRFFDEAAYCILNIDWLSRFLKSVQNRSTRERLLRTLLKRFEDYGLNSEDHGQYVWLAYRALQLSQHVLIHDPTQLGSQLMGRLDKNHVLYKQCHHWTNGGRPWLKPLRTPNLTVANDPCQMTLQGHSSGVMGVALQDGVIVSGSDDKTIKIWSVETGECLKTLQGHSESVMGVALQDGVIVSGSGDKTIKIWSVETGECLCTFNNDDHAINGVAIENNHIVAGDSKGVVHAFQLNTR